MNVLYLGTINPIFSIVIDSLSNMKIIVENEQNFHKGVLSKLEKNKYDIVFSNNGSTTKSIHDMYPSIYTCIISANIGAVEIEAIKQSPFKVSIASTYAEIIAVLKYIYANHVAENIEIASTIAPSVKVRCFGNFDVFINDSAVLFKSEKAKELLALLVEHRGGSLSVPLILSYMYPTRLNDIPSQNLIHKLKKTLLRELEFYNISYIITMTRGSICCNTPFIECDYFQALEGDVFAQRKFMGEYMKQYEWAEDTCGFLTDKFL